MHLAEETAVLKDQVDALRELSVQVLKEDSHTNYRSSFPPSAVVLDSPVRSHSNISFKSEDNNLEKEILAGNAIAMQMQQEAEKAAAELPMETEVIQQQPTSDNDDNTANTTSEKDSSKEKDNLEENATKEKQDDVQSTTSATEKTEESHLMH